MLDQNGVGWFRHSSNFLGYRIIKIEYLWLRIRGSQGTIHNPLWICGIICWITAYHSFQFNISLVFGYHDGKDTSIIITAIWCMFNKKRGLEIGEIRVRVRLSGILIGADSKETGQARKVICDYLADLAVLPNPPNAYWCLPGELKQSGLQNQWSGCSYWLPGNRWYIDNHVAP